MRPAAQAFGIVQLGLAVFVRSEDGSELQTILAEGAEAITIPVDINSIAGECALLAGIREQSLLLVAVGFVAIIWPLGVMMQVLPALAQEYAPESDFVAALKAIEKEGPASLDAAWPILAPVGAEAIARLVVAVRARRPSGSGASEGAASACRGEPPQPQHYSPPRCRASSATSSRRSSASRTLAVS